MKMHEVQQQAGDARGWDGAAATSPSQTQPGSPLMFMHLTLQGGRIVHSNENSPTSDISPVSVIPKPKFAGPGKTVHPCGDNGSSWEDVSPVSVMPKQTKLLPGNSVHPCDNDTLPDDVSNVSLAPTKPKLPGKGVHPSADNDAPSGDVSPVEVSPQRKTQRLKPDLPKLLGKIAYLCDDSDEIPSSEDVPPVKLSSSPQTKTPQPKVPINDTGGDDASPVQVSAEPPQQPTLPGNTNGLRVYSPGGQDVVSRVDNNESRRNGSSVTWADDFGLDLTEIREFEPSQKRSNSLLEVYRRWKERRSSSSSSSSSGSF